MSLSSFQCCIDLKNNLLRIGTTGTETAFLGEADVPICARLNRTESMEHTALESEDKQLAEALQRSAQDTAGWYPHGQVHFRMGRGIGIHTYFILRNMELTTGLIFF